MSRCLNLPVSHSPASCTQICLQAPEKFVVLQLAYCMSGLIRSVGLESDDYVRNLSPYKIVVKSKLMVNKSETFFTEISLALQEIFVVIRLGNSN